MNRITVRVVLNLLSCCLMGSIASAQMGGSRAGVESNSESATTFPLLAREVAESFIAIDGRVEVRVRPTDLRIVLAVTSEGQTPQACQLAIDETIVKLRTAWSGIGVSAENIVEDFIAVLPVYSWSLEKRGDNEVGVETKTGFRMQTNVHLAVPNDDNATKAFRLAFDHGVTDIIAFDYWSKDLDEVKVSARQKAIGAAQKKAEQLLTPLFKGSLPLINVQDQTDVHYPDSLYRSFVNAYDETVTQPWRSDTPFIRAYRPRNTYYRGLLADADIQAPELPMHPEISVISSVRLYFESPAAAKRATVKGDHESEKP